MTTAAGHPHHLGAGLFDTGPIVYAAIGMLLVVALLLGERARSITIARSQSRPATGSVTTATRPVMAVPTTALPIAAPVPAAPTASPVAPAIAAPAVVAASVSPPAPPFATTCADALAYLASHQAPGFVDTCAPGSALGHYGYTCANVVGRCQNVRIIHIACPAPFVFMNEAHNSWSVIGQGSGIDPYGQGNAAEQAACNGYR